MPSPSPDVTSPRASVGESGPDRLEEAHRSLQTGLASSEEAVASMVGAWTEFVRAFLPGVVTEPARTVDMVFEFVQQALSLQRRLARELIGTVQTAMAEAAADQPWSDGADGSRARSGTPRPAAARSAA